MTCLPGLLDSLGPREGMENLIHCCKQRYITYASSVSQIMNDGTLCTYFLAAVKKTGKYPRTYED